MYEDDFDLVADEEEEEDMDEGESDEKIAIENSYYEGKDLLQSKPPDLAAALKAFQTVIDLEAKQDEMEWTFSALEEIVKIKFALGTHEEVVPQFKLLLSYSNKVTENNLLKATNNILEDVSKCDNAKLISDMYETSLEVLQKKNERLWFRVYLKLGKVQLEQKDTDALEKTTANLWDWASKPGNKKARPTDKIEIYALQIQTAELLDDKPRIRAVYKLAAKLILENPDILDSKLSIFKFIGGKLKLEEGDMEESYSMLFEAFKYYVKIIGSEKTKPCVKYIIMANMLKRSWIKSDRCMSPHIDPFDSEQLQHLKQDPEIKPFAELHAAYQNLDLKAFERKMKTGILDKDPFLKRFKKAVLSKLHRFSTLQMLKPYATLKLDFIATKLSVSKDEVESLLVQLILDNFIAGKVDQVNGTLILDDKTDLGRYSSLERWATQLNSITGNLIASVG